MNQNSESVTIKILFFAKARELIGNKEVLERVPRKITGKNLLSLIIKKYELDRLKCNVILALNENWIDLNSDLILKEADEVAVIPPLSGGIYELLDLVFIVQNSTFKINKPLSRIS